MLWFACSTTPDKQVVLWKQAGSGLGKLGMSDYSARKTPRRSLDPGKAEKDGN